MTLLWSSLLLSLIRALGVYGQEEKAMLNQTLHNRYTLTAHIDSGAMGTVYRATDS